MGSGVMAKLIGISRNLMVMRQHDERGYASIHLP